MYALIGLMGEKHGAPYTSFPFSCMEFGKSATADSGGTCGCLMAGAMVMSLFWPRKIAIPMQAELQRWYEVTALPLSKPAPGKAKIDGDMASSVSDSILCHISVARWCRKSGFGSGSPERSERCARLTADVARKTAELIHAQMDGTFKRATAVSDMQKSCSAEGCHGPNTEKWQNANWKGTMDCAPCHTGSEAVKDKTKNHPI